MSASRYNVMRLWQFLLFLRYFSEGNSIDLGGSWWACAGGGSESRSVSSYWFPHFADRGVLVALLVFSVSGGIFF